ncbi:WD40-repeat-containing domain protein [Microdochium bolleyi]|uniref:methylated diphthine methylhydrolase n=1 Tax=Microdochium bolleyi TaxID=196109 RepID=A0A136J0F0_9PEZI|nr:WD40-repeat-containing domain protein [Microdochium bolleyi]
MTPCTTPIASLRSLTLDLPPSCIEFCLAHPAYFVVGTYNLQKEEGLEPPVEEAEHNSEGGAAVRKQSRDGSIIVFRLDNSELANTQVVKYPSAILDLHFHPGQPDVLAVVSSTGTLSFFRLSKAGQLTEIKTHSSLEPSDGVLFLSCVWHPDLHELLAITTSDFHVHVFRVDSDWNVHLTSDEPAVSHQLEAWTVAFSPLGTGTDHVTQTQEVTVFSGGDDSRLLASTLTYCSSELQDAAARGSMEKLYPARVFKGHQAGVTAILPLPFRLADGSSIIITGSYDDHIRVFSFAGPLTAPVHLAEENLGGGVWRLKTIGAAKSDGGKWDVVLLASCMHAGARIIRVSGDQEVGGCKIEVLGRFEEHKSMNYGSDYAPETDKPGRVLQCVSTSFYDKLLCLWEFTR